MAIEYLGNKTQLLDFVLDPIVGRRDVGTVADVFCGTASVSRALGLRGKRVVANDHLALCATLAEAALLSPPEPRFRTLRAEVRAAGGETTYDAVVRVLNTLVPEPGYFHATYSPASAPDGVVRMYLTEANAAKVDAVRARIEQWGPLLTRGERAVLLRDLVRAVTRVSNTAGTYGCYLKRWKPRALEPLQLEAQPSEPLRGSGHQVHHGDATELVAELDVDAVYLDPPYTKRQYAAYYHLLETLVSGDRPLVEGSTGLPPWQERSSDFCYRRRAPRALERIVERVRAPHVFLSYSEDGHITHEQILGILGAHGRVRSWEHVARRYRSSALRHRGECVRERLYHLAIA